MSKRSSKDDKKKILLGLFGLVGLYFLTKASNQNDNLTTAPVQTSPNTPVQTTVISQNNTAFIAKVQRFLTAQGYRVSVTGVWNTQTDKAQRAYMLKNGVFDSANFRKLVEGWREPINLVNLSRKRK